MSLNRKNMNSDNLLFIVIGGSILFFIMTIMVVGMPYMLGSIEPTSRAHEYSSLQEEGRELFISLGCNYCHSLFTRPQDWAQGNTSEAGDFLFDSPHTLGTERTGPDLSQIGGMRSSNWHYFHFKNPRSVSPGSIMPNFDFISKEEMDALIEYIQSQGSKNYETMDFQPSIPEEYRDKINPYMSLMMEAMMSFDFENESFFGDENIGNDFAKVFEEGKTIFSKNCIPCHGGSGNGQGPYARHVVTRPANLHERIINYPEPDAPFHFWRVSEGVPGTAMPTWKLSLSEEEIWQVNTYEMSFAVGSIRTLAGDFSDEESKKFSISSRMRPAIQGTFEEFEEGKKIFELFCVQCHGVGGQGNGPASVDSEGGYIWPVPANFTETGQDFSFYGQYVWKIKEGVETTNMPLWKYALNDDEIFKVIFYIQSFTSDEEYIAKWAPLYEDDFGRNLKG